MSGLCQNPGCNEPATWEVSVVYEYGPMNNPWEHRQESDAEAFCEGCKTSILSASETKTVFL